MYYGCFFLETWPMNNLASSISQEEMSLTKTCNVLYECGPGISEEDPNAVVVGLAPEEFAYENLNKAMRWKFVAIYLITSVIL